MHLLLSLVLSVFFSFSQVHAQASNRINHQNSGLAVIIVDMQSGFYERGGVTNSEGLKKLVQNQGVLIKWAIAKKIPVLFFEYSGFGVSDPRLLNLVKNKRHPHINIVKHEDDGFTSPSLNPALRFLKKWKVDTIVISGINGSACVVSTALGAIQNGFDVVSSADIVGNLNVNPPIYPNSTWFFEDNKFVVFNSLEDIIR